MCPLYCYLCHCLETQGWIMCLTSASLRNLLFPRMRVVCGHFWRKFWKILTWRKTVGFQYYCGLVSSAARNKKFTNLKRPRCLSICCLPRAVVLNIFRLMGPYSRNKYFAAPTAFSLRFNDWSKNYTSTKKQFTASWWGTTSLGFTLA